MRALVYSHRGSLHTAEFRGAGHGPIYLVSFRRLYLRNCVENEGAFFSALVDATMDMDGVPAKGAESDEIPPRTSRSDSLRSGLL